MSCNNNPCEQTNPCYEDCGCLNPTTFECLSLPGDHPAIEVTNDMNGKEVLAAINSKIDALVLGEVTAPDIYSKVSATDTTTGYLNDKLAVANSISKTILNSGGNEQIRFAVVPASIISTDSGNTIDIGTDGKLRAIWSCPPADISVLGGNGVTVTGTGPASDPFIVSINPSISIARSCFTNTWTNINLATITNTNVVYVSGTPQYRIKYDGTIEFKGSATFNVTFGAYSTSNRKQLATIGNVSTACVTAGEQAGTADLKSIMYIDAPATMPTTSDYITQQYGYIIRKSTQNLIIEFQSALAAGATKTIVVNFEGAISYPTI
jgi:hypothetical protein